MQWRDEALILGGRRFGESALILDALTASKGRRSGLVYGGASRKKRPQLEAGNTVELAWTGRLEEQLGRFNVAEVTTSRAGRFLDRAEALAALTTVTALLRGAVDEGDAAGSALFQPTILLLDALDNWPVWPALYAKWELGLLSSLGFGLDLDKCALSGANDGLTHVSPKTGRAVKGSEAEDYVERLFPLPAFLIDSSALAMAEDIEAALELTGYFLEERLFSSVHKPLPPERARLVPKLIG
ncbi:MAG: DNA repair protein RecO [Alphaproteobacteria bacterium]|nr:DNA repair protein RecO [Alphaproteobacteria bacterium]